MFYYSLRLLTAYFVFLYPAYAAFKSLSHRPVSEPELERWVKHFCVLGLVVTYDFTVEFFIAWLPFYWEVKALFLLFLALPQTQGSVYLYDLYLQPFFTRNEADIDGHIESARANILTFIQTRLAGILSAFWNIVIQAQAQANANAQQQNRPPPQPVLAIPSQLAMNVWTTFGSVLAGSIARANAPGAVPMPSQPDVARAAQVPLPPTPQPQA